MYDSYFGFSRLPFEANYERDFLFLSEGHKEVLASLTYFIQAKKAFAVVCGDVGTGKTMLIHCWLQSLPESVHPIVVVNPFVSSMDLLRYLAKTLKLPERQTGILELSDQVKQALVEAKGRGEQVVLIVDEAHLLSEQSLEEIRLLSNLETPEQKLLQILLVGQHELSHKLRTPAMRPLRQRININRFLSPLSAAETRQYVDHRLKRVGAGYRDCFEPNCQDLLYKMTGGVPRRLNQLCDNALLICMTKKQRKISRRILRRAEEAVNTDVILAPKGPKPALRRVLSLAAISVLSIAALLALGVISGQLGFTPGESTPASQPVSQEQQSPAKISEAASTAPEQTAGRGAGEGTAAPGPAPEKAADFPVNFGHQEVAEPAADPVQVEQSPPRTEAPPQEVKQETPPGGNIPLRVVVRPGESLGVIVSRHYPDHRPEGLLAIRLANRQDLKDEVIYPGQILTLPKVTLDGQKLRLDDHLFYVPYGRYNSQADLNRDTNWLKKNKIKFLVLRSREARGKTGYQVVLGGYDQENEAQAALAAIKTKANSGS